MKSKKIKKILVVFGTRPEAIKLAPLIKEFQKHEDEFELRVCNTAQHRQMCDEVLELFDIKTNYDLDTMKEGQDLFDTTSSILVDLREVLEDFEPDIVCVHGDTTTTFTTSLACYYKKIDVAHIEAGLRTFKKYSPFPEEIYRELICKITAFHFPPTQNAKNNLLRDNIEEKNILVTGNTVIDTLHLTLVKIKNSINIKATLQSKFDKDIDLEVSKFILVTAHRRENFGEGLKNIANALKILALNNPNIDIIYPLHLNPNVRKPMNAIIKDIKNIYLIEPLKYELFIYLMSKSYIILTDSGGIQEEAPSLGKPVLVLRDDTERTEAIQAGTIKLIGTSKDDIITHTQKLLDDKGIYDEMSKAHNPYGDGKSCKSIVEFLK